MQKKILQRMGLVVGTGAILFVGAATINVHTSETGHPKEVPTKFDFSTINATDYVPSINYTDKSLVTIKPKGITDADVDEELISVLTYTPVYEKITDQTVENGDSVNIDYTAKIGDTIISCEAGSRIDIGEGDSLKEVSDSLIGRTPGKQYPVIVILPEDYKGTYMDSNEREQDLAGSEAEFLITINYIYGKEKTADTLTDTDVSELTSGMYENIADFKEFLEQKLITAQEAKALQSVWESMIESCVISQDKKNNYNELVNYEYDYELGYYNQMAEAYGTDLDTLAVNYGYDNMDAFKESIQTDSEEIVKHYLIAYSIAQREELLLTEEEIRQAETELLSDYNVSSVEDLVALYGETEVKLYVQLQKVDEFLKATLQIKS